MSFATTVTDQYSHRRDNAIVACDAGTLPVSITRKVECGIMRGFLTQAVTERRTMSPTLLLLFYCLAIAGFSLMGGLLPGWIRMTHTRTQVVMSLVSGLMLGVAFYHLLPHSVALAGGSRGIDTAVWWVMVGLIVMLLLLRVFC